MVPFMKLLPAGLAHMAVFNCRTLLGHLYANPLHGATVPFYGCKRAQTDYFVSLDILCEGQRILGKQGYGYPQPVPGLNLVPLYRCSTDTIISLAKIQNAKVR